jgi:hypothetical protein
MSLDLGSEPDPLALTPLTRPSDPRSRAPHGTVAAYIAKYAAKRRPILLTTRPAETIHLWQLQGHTVTVAARRSSPHGVGPPEDLSGTQARTALVANNLASTESPKSTQTRRHTPQGPRQYQCVVHVADSPFARSRHQPVQQLEERNRSHLVHGVRGT